MKQLIRTPSNYSTIPRPGESNNSPSLTVPDQSMSVMELIRRFGQGLPLTGLKTPLYEEEGDPETIDPRKMDLSEVEEELDRISERIAERKQKLNEDMAEKRKLKEEAENASRKQKWREEFEAEKAKSNSTT